jgi:hypothetical protein
MLIEMSQNISWFIPNHQFLNLSGCKTNATERSRGG